MQCYNRITTRYIVGKLYNLNVTLKKFTTKERISKKKNNSIFDAIYYLLMNFSTSTATL